MSGFWKVCSFLCIQYLVGPPFAWITASIRRGMEAISLWHCSGVMEAQVALIVAFRSSALLGLVSLIFLLTIPHRLSMHGVQVRWVCWPIKHSNTMVIEPAFGTFGSVGRCQVLLEKWNQHLHKACQQKEAWKCSKMSWYMAALTVDFRKHSGPTPADDMAAQIITDWGNFTLDFKQHGFCASPLFLQTLGPWFPNEKLNLLPSEKRTLDHWATGQLFSSLAEVRCFWWCLFFRSGLVALFLKMSEHGDSWCTDSSFSPLLVKLSQVFESALLDSILKLAVIPVVCAPFPTQFLPSSQLCFSNAPLWFTLFVEGVNDRLLDHCQVSSVPHYCGFKEQEIPGIYSVWMIIYWNSNVNILILWDTGFLTFMSCKL